MELKKTLIIAILLSIIGLGLWEVYWRSQGYYPNLDDNKELWTVQRAKVNQLSSTDVVLTGSSRALFDIQLNEWEAETGKRPLQLASAGSSPLPIFHDLVENTGYTGTIIVGVTPGLFFSTTYPLALPWDWPQTRVNHFNNRTYAQRLNHQISLPLQKSFVFLSANEMDWTDNIDLKSLLKTIHIGDRVIDPMPPFYNFYDTLEDRNTTMTLRTAIDTTFANTIKKVWRFYGSTSPPPDKESTMAFFLKDAEKFKAKGGNLILMRCPSSGGARAGENHALPRKDFWDDLVKQAKVKSYHFEDYEQFKTFNCPEWSHLSKEDAKYFTSELAKIMISDGAISNSKTN